MKQLDALKIAEDMMFENITRELRKGGRESVDDARVMALGTVRRMIDTKIKYGKTIAFQVHRRATQRQNGS